MKTLFCIAFVVILNMQLTAQTWQATNLTSVAYLPITGIESHNNELFATVANGFTATLYQLNANNTSWSSMNIGSIAYPKFLRSTGSKLYLSSVDNLAYSTLYYSVNNGSTFVVDTVGLPRSNNQVGLIYGIQYYNGRLIVNMGSAGYYLKDTSAVSWHHIDVPTALNGGGDPITFDDDTLYAYDNTGTHTLYVSGDYGNTWNVRTTNLPANYATTQFLADTTTGRIYSFGAWNSSSQFGLYYSDDHGFTWTQVNTTGLIGLNHLGGQQLVTAMYSSGQTFYMALQNNKNSSAPDVVGTTTGIANLAHDTLGLPTNAAGGVYGFYILSHKNNLVVSLNVIDTYIKGSSSSGFNETLYDPVITLFPNPANTDLYIQTQKKYDGVRITNTEGKTVWQENRGLNSIDISSLSKGVYFIELMNGQKSAGTSTFIRE